MDTHQIPGKRAADQCERGDDTFERAIAESGAPMRIWPKPTTPRSNPLCRDPFVRPLAWQQNQA